MRPAFFGACLLATACLVAGGASAAKGDRVPSELSFKLTHEGEAVRGTVRSDEKACEGNRRVVIKKSRDGAPDVPVASARTGADGRYKVAIILKYDVPYYAQVRGENRGPAAVPCKGARSFTVTITQASPIAG